MSYSAHATLLYGYPLPECPQEQELREKFWRSKKGKICVCYTGDARVKVHSPVIGIVIADGDEYMPTVVDPRVSKDQIDRLHQVMEAYRIPREEGAKMYLVVWIA